MPGDLPMLATLDFPPSWVNRAGRVDRSACVVLRASVLRLMARPGDWGVPAGLPPLWRILEAAAAVEVRAGTVEAVMSRSRPRELAGDFRTGKSNAMAVRGRAGQRVASPGGTEPGPDYGLPINPNRGATYRAGGKSPALPADWSCTVRVERWRLHARLAQHFVVCPVCGQKPTPSGGGVQVRQYAGAGPVQPIAPRGQVIEPAIVDADRRKPQRLPRGRAAMLYLPLATEVEARDAVQAWDWLWRYRPLWAEAWRRGRYVDAVRQADAAVQRLVGRYGVLFAPRRPTCRACLGLRYGEAKRRKVTVLAPMRPRRDAVQEPVWMDEPAWDDATLLRAVLGDDAVLEDDGEG